MSSTSLNKFSNILLFKHKIMSKYTESRTKHQEEYFDPKSPNSLSTKQEDADVEDNNLLDDAFEKRSNNFSVYLDHRDDYGSDVFLTTRSNSPLSQTRSTNTVKPLVERKVSFSKPARVPKDEGITLLEKKRSSSIAASPLLLTTTISNTNKKNRRQSAPVTSVNTHHTKEQIVDEMEREQERVVLKLMKQIHDLKTENQHLKRELTAFQGSRGNSFSKRTDTYSDRNSSMSSVFPSHTRTLSNASTVYNPRNNSVSTTSFRENVLTDFESLK